MEEVKLSRNIFILTNRLKRLLDKKYSTIGLYVGQARILAHLYKNKESKIYQKDIENTFQIRGGTVTGMIDSLVSQEYINRIESETDKRKRKIVLTASGEEAAVKCIKIIADFESELSNELSKEEKSLFNNLINKINIWLENEENK